MLVTAMAAVVRHGDVNSEPRIIVFTIVVLISITVIIATGNSTAFDTHSITIGTLIILSGLIGMFFGVAAGRAILPRMLIYKHLIVYLRIMRDGAIAYGIGYISIAALFATFYWASHRFDGSSLSNLPSATFGNFFYFSLVTIATVGYGDIAPATPLCKTIASVEILVGLAWTLVVFAALVFYLQKEVEQEAQQNRVII